MTTSLLEKKIEQLERRMNAMQKLFTTSAVARQSTLSMRERRAILEQTGGGLKGKLNPQSRKAIWQRAKGMWEHRKPDTIKELGQIRKGWNRS